MFVNLYVVRQAAGKWAALIELIMVMPMETKTSCILVVDDDAQIRQLLKQYLELHAYCVTGVADGRLMDRELHRMRYDLLVLDLLLPQENGLAICRRLRQDGQTIPIVMLTAQGSDHDRIVGLDYGADDYLPKPFNPRELLARIQAILRRVARLPSGVSAPDREPVRFGQFTFDILTRELLCDGRPMAITSGDFALMKIFTTHPHQPLSRAKLAALAHGRDHDAYDRNIDVRVSRLRKMIESDSNRPRFIQTVWGLGYIFVPSGREP